MWPNYNKNQIQEKVLRQEERLDKLTKEIDYLIKDNIAIRERLIKESNISFPDKENVPKRSVKEVLIGLTDYLELEIQVLPRQPPAVWFTKKGN